MLCIILSQLLTQCYIKINFFVDKYKDENSKLNNILIKHPKDIQDDNSNIIIASTQFNEEIYHELISMGINKNRIVDSLFLWSNSHGFVIDYKKWLLMINLDIKI